eukprot:CAMPEP_0119381240 /NCGR_PEP_ID=MMETSP1334-20130426/62263_1 /TAXON_ID=127549 /ORGANISM="Calcidiscus leptoporus, Strain RCC1130" /LENGTH=81 /DNA_ID=CAMNT_0007401301 /DNA_START=122 /DNA_END=365 /DNA_ORIENTATION=+
MAAAAPTRGQADSNAPARWKRPGAKRGKNGAAREAARSVVSAVGLASEAAASPRDGPEHVALHLPQVVTQPADLVVEGAQD